MSDMVKKNIKGKFDIKEFILDNIVVFNNSVRFARHIISSIIEFE